MNEAQLEFVIQAALQDWREVEPAIFGTLLERALNPRERHKLGAHYTPRAYVERLVNQTVLEPLRERWAVVQVEVSAELEPDKSGAVRKDAAIKKIERFHYDLCHVRILDPACGSGIAVQFEGSG